MANNAKKIGWFLLDVLPDAVTLVRHGRKALKEKKLSRQERREGILATFRATQKTKRDIPG